MKRDDFIEWAKKKGFKDTGYGVKNIRLIRDDMSFKVSKLAIRYEKKIEGKWYKLMNNYLKNISIDENDMLQGLKK